jgi:putative DNA primase/helicase
LVKKQIEEEIVSKILEQVRIITVGDTGGIYRLLNGVYKELSQNQIDYIITSEFQEQNIEYTRTKKNITLDLLKSTTHVPTWVIEQSTENIINCLNGFYYLNEKVDLFTVDENGEGITVKKNFTTHRSPSVFSFTQIPVNYDPKAQCPNIDRFLAEVFGKDKVESVYDFIGYLLLPHVKYQRAMILVGSGKNGKTTFLDLVIRFLGVDNIAQIALQDLSYKFSMYNLKNKMANIVSDIPSKSLIDTGNAKMIVTDATLSGQIKNIQGVFNFNNRCKMLYSCNKLPRNKDDTSAFYRRWCMYICNAIFDENKDVEIVKKITTNEELSGLLNRALEGIERLKKNNGFPNTEEEVKDIWTMETNPIAEFIIKHCRKKKGSEIRSKDLFYAINSYRSKQGETILDYRKIGYWLRQYGINGIQRPDYEVLRSDGSPKWYVYYQDIELLNKDLLQSKLEYWSDVKKE